MYAGFVAFVPGTALLLGSRDGVFVGLIFVGMVAGRAVLEERTLWKGLKGYDLYVAQVKYRLIPYIW
jgi:protein-S-isoprenylcysteine O-methyltransferase Ste14